MPDQVNPTSNRPVPPPVDRLSAKERRAFRVAILSGKRRAAAAPLDQNPVPTGKRRNALDLSRQEVRDIFVEASQGVNVPTRLQSNAPNPQDLQEALEVIVSVRDGVIGSIYFDDCRIRTTHRSGGPTIERLSGSQQRFQMNETEAFSDFAQNNPELVASARAELPSNLSAADQQKNLERALAETYLTWAASVLGSAEGDPDQTPDWAIKINTPDDAAPLDDDEEISEHDTLFEVDTNPRIGQQNAWHVSRGAPRSFSITRREVDALVAAVRLANPEQSAQLANERFFDALGSQAPDLARRLRRP